MLTMLIKALFDTHQHVISVCVCVCLSLSHVFCTSHTSSTSEVMKKADAPPQGTKLTPLLFPNWVELYIFSSVSSPKQFDKFPNF